MREHLAHPYSYRRIARAGRLRHIALATAALALAALPADAQLSLDAGVMVGGGGISRSAGGCLRLGGTLGEPVSGVSSGGTFTLSAGFSAHSQADSRDGLFNSGFEDCL